MQSSLRSREFGRMPDGQPVYSFLLTGSGGLVLEVLSFGGIVRSLLVPDREGHLADVVLGFNTLQQYLDRHPYFGAIIGRVAGRTRGAAFRDGNDTFPLSANEGGNHLHGGFRGFDKKLWTATPLGRPDGCPSLQLTANSREGEEGYPGNLKIRVTYTVREDNTFLIETEAEADRRTPCSLTHHSYFNLGGEGSGSIHQHHVQILADEYALTDDTMTLSGNLRGVENSGEDLRLSTPLASALPRLFRNHGALYKLRNSNNELVQAASVFHPASGRMLEVFTTDSYMQMYTGSSLDGSLMGKSGTYYGPHDGLCLECQGYPDPWNATGIASNVLQAGVTQYRTTAYRFSAVKSQDGGAGA